MLVVCFHLKYRSTFHSPPAFPLREIDPAGTVQIERGVPPLINRFCLCPWLRTTTPRSRSRACKGRGRGRGQGGIQQRTPKRTRHDSWKEGGDSNRRSHASARVGDSHLLPCAGFTTSKETHRPLEPGGARSQRLARTHDFQNSTFGVCDSSPRNCSTSLWNHSTSCIQKIPIVHIKQYSAIRRHAEYLIKRDDGCRVWPSLSAVAERVADTRVGCAVRW